MLKSYFLIQNSLFPILFVSHHVSSISELIIVSCSVLKTITAIPYCHPMLLIASFFCWWPASLKWFVNELAWSLMCLSHEIPLAFPFITFMAPTLMPAFGAHFNFIQADPQDLIKSNGIPLDFSNQISSNPMEFYENLIDIHRFQAISKILWFRGRLFRGETRKDLPRSIWPCGGGD